jgi:hypothetical protein
VTLWGDRVGAEPAAVAAVAPAVATRLAHASVEATTDLADTELALGRSAAAATRLTAQLAEQPIHERAAALLMDALAAQGRQAEALALYERVREALADALGTDPGVVLRERHLRLLRTDHTPPTDPVDDPPPSNLPAPVTSFIGRDDDLTRLDTLLAAGRLVTVLGPGGAGKTRLALEAARRHRHEYRDGTWMIDLASSSRPMLHPIPAPTTRLPRLRRRRPTPADIATSAAQPAPVADPEPVEVTDEVSATPPAPPAPAGPDGPVRRGRRRR